MARASAAGRTTCCGFDAAIAVPAVAWARAWRLTDRTTRVVAHPGEEDHGVEARRVLALGVATIGPQRLHAVPVLAENAGGKEAKVEPHDIMVGLLERRADISVVAGYEYTQVNLPTTAG